MSSGQRVTSGETELKAERKNSKLNIKTLSNDKLQSTKSESIQIHPKAENNK